MLFNSYVYLFILLPVSVVVFYLIGARGHHRVAVSWLVAVSLFFYGWWNPAYLMLIVASMLGNYALGIALSEKGEANRKTVLALGVLANLGLLGYYKYANFFVDNMNLVLGADFHLNEIILPLAISFFTFQQIAYLVDAYRGETREYNFLHYCLFVTFFPQLIAGPIVHHKEMLPQFARDNIYRFNSTNIAVGVSIFIVGLFKKVILADNIAAFASPVFAAADGGQSVGFYESWGGAIAYSLQLYFDFSGYADMAIGSARMFGIKLPVNFNSPYKATSIIEFWRRWHITLSRFLRDYLYIPLGGSRKGLGRRYVNLMITMLLGGLWHGAGWTFIVWGGLHGSYLVINHFWRSMSNRAGANSLKQSSVYRALAWVITYLAVLIAWVFFRAETFGGAIEMLGAMTRFDTAFAPLGSVVTLVTTEMGRPGWFYSEGLSGFLGATWIISLTLIAVFLPNTQSVMRRWEPAIGVCEEVYRINLEWRPSLAWGIILGGMLMASLVYMQGPSEFLYWQF